MLTHDKIIYAVEHEYPDLKHGRDFVIGHPVDSGGVQIGEPFVLEWRTKTVAEPNIADLTKIFNDQYASAFYADLARQQRDFLLRQTDWTQNADVPAALRESYIPYRQALRDLPQQGGFPSGIEWPKAPGT